MNTTTHYVVLRLATDPLRGEVINAGIALWRHEEPIRILSMASLNKLRAIDTSWTSAKQLAWVRNIESICAVHRGIKNQVGALARLGFCDADAVGMFHADGESELKNRLAELRKTYISNTSKNAEPREKRTRLQTQLRAQFERMQVLGHDANDIANHLVVPNLPVPAYPELKNDFVYKNGVYRITQTIDYNVSADGVHQKLQEACVKSTAAELSMRGYGKSTKRYAVLDIPDAYLDATDAHIDLLVAQGFEVFHFNKPAEMDKYLKLATP